MQHHGKQSDRFAAWLYPVRFSVPVEGEVGVAICFKKADYRLTSDAFGAWYSYVPGSWVVSAACA